MSGAHIAVHAAMAARQEQQEEEESMTRYANQDLEGGWEFKIIRSATGAFGKTRALAQALEEERLGDWELVEKFDDNRVRLKRPAAARGQDHTRPRGYDPYRTKHGMSEGTLGLIIALVIFGLVGIGLGIAFLTGSL